MPEMTTSNAQHRAAVLAQVERELKMLLPDEGPPTVRSFDDLEAVAVRMGDALASSAMTRTLENVFTLPQCTKQGRCKCGRNLIWSDKPRTLETVRGTIFVTRLHGYCRVCERGFFPRG
jgi:hypothetical protein